MMCMTLSRYHLSRIHIFESGWFISAVPLFAERKWEHEDERSESPAVPLPLFTASPFLASLRLAAERAPCKNVGKNGRTLTAFASGETARRARRMPTSERKAILA